MPSSEGNVSAKAGDVVVDMKQEDHDSVVHGIVRLGFVGVVFLLGDLQA